MENENTDTESNDASDREPPASREVRWKVAVPGNESGWELEFSEWGDGDELVTVTLVGVDDNMQPSETTMAFVPRDKLREALARTLVQIGPADMGADTQVAKVAIELTLHQTRAREHAEVRCKDALEKLADATLDLGRLQGENGELKKALGRDD